MTLTHQRASHQFHFTGFQTLIQIFLLQSIHFGTWQHPQSQGYLHQCKHVCAEEYLLQRLLQSLHALMYNWGATKQCLVTENAAETSFYEFLLIGKWLWQPTKTQKSCTRPHRLNMNSCTTIEFVSSTSPFDSRRDHDRLVAIARFFWIVFGRANIDHTRQGRYNGQFLGQNMTTHTPAKAMRPPMTSPLSGWSPSNAHANKNDNTIKKPPYTAYILPKLSLGCKHGIKPYAIKTRLPATAYHHGFRSCCCCCCTLGWWLLATSSILLPCCCCCCRCWWWCCPRTATQINHPPTISATPAKQKTITACKTFNGVHLNASCMLPSSLFSLWWVVSLSISSCKFQSSTYIIAR